MLWSGAVLHVLVDCSTVDFGFLGSSFNLLSTLSSSQLVYNWSPALGDLSSTEVERCALLTVEQ